MPKDFNIYELEFTKSGAGGRISSPELRRSQELSESFSGLEENIKRYDLLLLVKRVGKSAGFSARMIELLDYYMSFTRDIDWEQGGRPIVYQSLSRTSLDLGISERQIQRLEQSLFEVGAITWNDSGNHKRYGQRDPQSGKILYAYGVDLSPLAYLREELEAKRHEKQLYDQAWMKTKREISQLRRHIKGIMAEYEGQGGDITDYDKAYQQINGQIRTHMKLEVLRTLLEQHKSLYDTLLKSAEGEQKSQGRAVNDSKITRNESCKSDKRVSHYKYTTQKQTNNLNLEELDSTESETRNGLSEEVVANLEHITLAMVLGVASEEFRAKIPITGAPLTWSDLINVAYRLKTELGISQKAWAYACQLLGRKGAAIALIITDTKRFTEHDPVRNPAAYFNGMLEKAKHNELNLTASVFGLLEKV